MRILSLLFFLLLDWVHVMQRSLSPRYRIPLRKLEILKNTGNLTAMPPASLKPLNQFLFVLRIVAQHTYLGGNYAKQICKCEDKNKKA